MKRCRALAVTLSIPCTGVGSAWAQPADLPIPAATTTEYPAGISVARTAAGSVYVASDGRTLYGMDMRTLLRSGADAAQYCQAVCTASSRIRRRFPREESRSVPSKGEE
jgi:hypothetical protein